MGSTVHNTGYSAFGSTEPLLDKRGQRIRWFCPWYLDHTTAAVRAMEAVTALEEADTVTRITLRVVSRGELIPEVIEALAGEGFRVEATMAVGDASNRVITYVARCSPQRRSTPEDSAGEADLLAAIQGRPRKGPALIIREFRQREDFRVELVDPGSLSPSDVDRLLAMHRATFPTFPYDFGSKLELMLAAPDDYLMFQVRSVSNHRIYAFSNLEFNTVTLEGGESLQLAEYDNSMRADHCPEYGQLNGLGAILRLRLAEAAHRREVDLCHAESRAGAAGINSISYDLGMQFGGTLERHLCISGQTSISYRRPSPFESMNVWYLNRNQLKVVAEQACQPASISPPQRDRRW